MAVQELQRWPRQSIASMPTKLSSQLITPKSRWKSMAKTIATAAIEVTFGTEIAIRNSVRARNWVRLSRFARKSASNN